MTHWYKKTGYKFPRWHAREKRLVDSDNVKPVDLQHFADLMGNKKMFKIVMSKENKEKPVAERIEIAKQYVLNYKID